MATIYRLRGGQIVRYPTGQRIDGEPVYETTAIAHTYLPLTIGRTDLLNVDDTTAHEIVELLIGNAGEPSIHWRVDMPPGAALEHGEVVT